MFLLTSLLLPLCLLHNLVLLRQHGFRFCIAEYWLQDHDFPAHEGRVQRLQSLHSLHGVTRSTQGWNGKGNLVWWWHKESPNIIADWILNVLLLFRSYHRKTGNPGKHMMTLMTWWFLHQFSKLWLVSQVFSPSTTFRKSPWLSGSSARLRIQISKSTYNLNIMHTLLCMNQRPARINTPRRCKTVFILKINLFS